MFARQTEEEFVNTVDAGADSDLDRSRWGPLLVVAALIGGFIAWAVTFEIEEVTRGSGRVIPSSQVQTVQSLEGGIVSAINVREGDLVEAGDVLMQIDDTGAGARQGELQEQQTALLAEQVRLRAEAGQDSEIRFDPEFAAAHPLAVAAETEVFLSRREQLRSELSVLQSALEQRISELAELEALQEKRRLMIAPLTEEQE